MKVKRLLALLLAIVMVAGMLPMSASAAGEKIKLELKSTPNFVPKKQESDGSYVDDNMTLLATYLNEDGDEKKEKVVFDYTKYSQVAAAADDLDKYVLDSSSKLNANMLTDDTQKAVLAEYRKIAADAKATSTVNLGEYVYVTLKMSSANLPNGIFPSQVLVRYDPEVFDAPGEGANTYAKPTVNLLQQTFSNKLASRQHTVTVDGQAKTFGYNMTMGTTSAVYKITKLTNQTNSALENKAVMAMAPDFDGGLTKVMGTFPDWDIIIPFKAKKAATNSEIVPMVSFVSGPTGGSNGQLEFYSPKNAIAPTNTTVFTTGDCTSYTGLASPTTFEVVATTVTVKATTPDADIKTGANIFKGEEQTVTLEANEYGNWKTGLAAGDFTPATGLTINDVKVSGKVATLKVTAASAGALTLGIKADALTGTGAFTAKDVTITAHEKPTYTVNAGNTVTLSNVTSSSTYDIGSKKNVAITGTTATIPAADIDAVTGTSVSVKVTVAEGLSTTLSISRAAAPSVSFNYADETMTFTNTTEYTIAGGTKVTSPAANTPIGDNFNKNVSATNGAVAGGAGTGKVSFTGTLKIPARPTLTVTAASSQTGKIDGNTVLSTSNSGVKYWVDTTATQTSVPAGTTLSDLPASKTVEARTGQHIHLVIPASDTSKTFRSVIANVAGVGNNFGTITGLTGPTADNKITLTMKGATFVASPANNLFTIAGETGAATLTVTNVSVGTGAANNTVTLTLSAEPTKGKTYTVTVDKAATSQTGANVAYQSDSAHQFNVSDNGYTLTVGSGSDGTVSLGTMKINNNTATAVTVTENWVDGWVIGTVTATVKAKGASGAGENASSWIKVNSDGTLTFTGGKADIASKAYDVEITIKKAVQPEGVVVTATATKTYDGTTDLPASDAITSTLVPSDLGKTPAFSGSMPGKDVGTQEVTSGITVTGEKVSSSSKLTVTVTKAAFAGAAQKEAGAVNTEDITAESALQALKGAVVQITNTADEGKLSEVFSGLTDDTLNGLIAAALLQAQKDAGTVADDATDPDWTQADGSEISIEISAADLAAALNAELAGNYDATGDLSAVEALTVPMKLNKKPVVQGVAVTFHAEYGKLAENEAGTDVTVRTTGGKLDASAVPTVKAAVGTIFRGWSTEEHSTTYLKAEDVAAMTFTTPTTLYAQFVGYIAGDEYGFRPDDQVNRAELLRMLLVVTGNYDPSVNYGTAKIPDGNGDWYQNYFACNEQMEKPIMVGDEYGYRPLDFVRRDEAAFMIANAFAPLGLELKRVEEITNIDFTQIPDWNTIQEFAYDAVATLYSNGTVHGDEYGFRPAAGLLRCEAVKMINTYLGMTPEKRRQIKADTSVKDPFLDAALVNEHWAYADIMFASLNVSGSYYSYEITIPDPVPAQKSAPRAPKEAEPAAVTAPATEVASKGNDEGTEEDTIGGSDGDPDAEE